MTQNQIAYANARELQRHNKSAEEENIRHNKVIEAYEKWKNELTAIGLDETRRTNLANEEIRRQQNAINAGSIEETVRHNAAVEQLSALTTASQNALNKSLQGQAAANSAASYANAMLSQEKVKTEKSVQSLNRANAVLSGSQSTLNATKSVNYATEMNYVISQTDLNRATLKKVAAETGRVQVQTQHEGVNMFWDSVNSAKDLLFSGRKKIVNPKNRR